MRTMHQWLEEYGDSHRNPVNKAIHRVCVPAIVFSVLGFLWLIPVPQAAALLGPWANWATLTVALAAVYYLALSPALALGMAAVVGAMLIVVHLLQTRAGVPLWLLFAALFVVAWIGQFVGHRIEGKKPSFFMDLQFLLIGPAWLLADLYRQLGYDPAPGDRGSPAR